jgi:hypothetical protein
MVLVVLIHINSTKRCSSHSELAGSFSVLKFEGRLNLGDQRLRGRMVAWV